MQGHQLLVVALLASASAMAPSAKEAELHDFSCFANIKGFPTVGEREANAESILTSVRAKRDAANASAAMPEGTMKSDTCSEDEFGELTMGSMKELFRLVDLKETDNFMDLGSGLGEVPVSAAVLKGVHHATGVELYSTRHQAACRSLTKLSDELDKNSKGENASMVELVQGDLLKMDLREATVVFSNNYCFHKHLNDKLAEKLASELPEGARIASTEAFVDLPPRLVRISESPLPLGEGVSVSLYEVQGKVPPKGEKPAAVRMSRRQMKQEAIARKHRKETKKAERAATANKKLSLLRKSLQGK